MYIGTPDNDQFVGPQDPQELAEHIYRSTGPSGPNRDYLWGLEAALDELSPESGDEHVTDLSDRVRAIAAREDRKQGLEADWIETAGREAEGELPSASTHVSVSDFAASPKHQPSPVLQREHQHHEQPHDFRRASSIDEQEETEKAP